MTGTVRGIARSLSHRARRTLIQGRLLHQIMATMTGIMEQPVGYDVQKIQQIKEKIKQVFDRDCLMNDTMLLKRYTIAGDGDLVMILR